MSAASLALMKARAPPLRRSNLGTQTTVGACTLIPMNTSGPTRPRKLRGVILDSQVLWSARRPRAQLDRPPVSSSRARSQRLGRNPYRDLVHTRTDDRTDSELRIRSCARGSLPQSSRIAGHIAAASHACGTRAQSVEFCLVSAAERPGVRQVRCGPSFELIGALAPAEGIVRGRF